MTNKIRLVYDTSKVQPKDWAGYHGEDIELEVGFVNYGQPCEIPDGATATYYYRDDTMEPGTWHSAPAVISGNKAVVHWSAVVDGGADVNTWFLGIDDGGELLYKATGRMRLYPSPGFVPSVLPPALQVLDFDRYDVRNAPYYTKPETDTLLTGKADTEHGHAVSDVDGLQAALDGKLSTAAGAVGTANIANSAVTEVKIANNSATWAKLGSDAKNAINGKVDRNGDTMTGVLNLDAPGLATVYLSDYSFDGYISSYDGNMFQAAEEEGAQIHMMVSGSFSFEVYDPDAGEYITHTVDASFEMAWEYSGGWQYMGDAIDLDGYMFWPSMYTYDDDYGRCIDLQLDNYDYYISIYMYMEEQYAEEIQRDKVGPVVVEDEIAGFAKAEDVASAVSTAVASHDSSASAHSSLLVLYAKYEPVYILKTSSSASTTLTAPAWGREYTANMQSVGNKTYTIDLPDLQKIGVSDTTSIAMSGYFSITGVVSKGTSIAVRYRYGVPSAGYHTANYTIYKPSDWTEWWGTKTQAIVRVCLHVFATKQYSGSLGTHYAPKIEIYLASPDAYNRGDVTDASFAGMSTKWDKVQ